MQILFTVHSKLNGSKNSFNPHITCFCFFYTDVTGACCSREKRQPEASDQAC